MSKPKRETNIQVPDQILKQLLTISEMRMLKNRFKIVKLLEDGLSIRNIAKQVRVGTDTVVRVAKMTEKQNLRKRLNKTLRLRSGSTTPWIFGKSE